VKYTVLIMQTVVPDLLADAKPREDLAEQVVRDELTRDLPKRILSAAEFLRHKLDFLEPVLRTTQR
jgi:hypothetical protein